jgi:hypothetical protein
MIRGKSSDSGWKRPFEDPIPLPSGRRLVTLKDAGNYITKLPKTEHEAPEWQAAMQALILVATRDGPTMLARIGIMRALNRHVRARAPPRRSGAGALFRSGAAGVAAAAAGPLRDAAGATPSRSCDDQFTGHS